MPQGNPRILGQLREVLERQGRRHTTVLLSGARMWGPPALCWASNFVPALQPPLCTDLPLASLVAEVSPPKLAALSQGIDAWVQIACPRLSIDWGEGFTLPTLNPYEVRAGRGGDEAAWA